MTTEILPEGFDFTDPDVNWEAIPHEHFAALRMSAPVHWVEQVPEARDGIAPEAGTGYWAVTKHADVSAVSKDSKNWSSAENGAIIRYGREITRDPNPHQAFGGHGAHYCIGANLARLEVNLIFEALADLAPDIRQLGEPRRLRHGWINGVKDLRVAYR